MWDNGIYTKFSCQGTDDLEDSAYISFDSPQSAKRFLSLCSIAKSNVTMDLIKDSSSGSSELMKVSLIKVDINNLDVIDDGLLSIRFNPKLIPLFESSLP